MAKYPLTSKLFKTHFVVNFLICNVLMMRGKIRRRNMSISFLLLHLQILVDLASMAGVGENKAHTSCQSCLLHTSHAAKIHHCSAIFFQVTHLADGVFLHCIAAVSNTETSSVFRVLPKTTRIGHS